MTQPQERDRPQQGWSGVETIETKLVPAVAEGPAGDADRPGEPQAAGVTSAEARSWAAPGHPTFREWDRTQWVGEGQEPPGWAGSTPRAETEPRWTKWQWVGEGQGKPGPLRGLAAAAMPDGENGLSGHRHNPGMAHWGGSRAGRALSTRAATSRP